MDEKDLDEIEAYTNAATEGPWRRSRLGSWHELLPEGETIVGPKSALYEDEELEANAVFMIKARSDVPRLVAEVRRLRAELAAVSPGKAPASDA